MKVTIETPHFEDIISLLANLYQSAYPVERTDQAIYLDTFKYRSYFRAMDFNRGIGLFSFHLRLPEPLTLSFRLAEFHPLRFLYCVAGRVMHQSVVGHMMQYIQEKEFVSYICREGVEQIVHFPARQFIQCVGLQLTREAYQARKPQVKFPKAMDEVMEDHALPMYLYHGNYPDKTARCLEQILVVRPAMTVQQYEARARNLLDSQLQQYDSC